MLYLVPFLGVVALVCLAMGIFCAVQERRLLECLGLGVVCGLLIVSLWKHYRSSSANSVSSAVTHEALQKK